ncbi:hypothetical protein, partial [Corynebacterium casei]
MKLTKNYYIKKSTNPTRTNQLSKVKSVYPASNTDNNYIDIQYAPLKYLTIFNDTPLTTSDIRYTPTTKHPKEYLAQHNPHPHNTDK